MNKIVASFGIAALGVSTIPNALAQVQSAHGKPWAVSATLRGFYDDNINGTSDNEVDSFGYELSPAVGLDWRGDQTSVKLGYRYSLRHYDEERFETEGHDSHTHTFEGAFDHTFSERYSLSVRDSFVVGQEPDLLRATYGGGAPLTPVPGDNIRNYGSIVFNAAMTPSFDLEAGYDNQWFDYDNSGAVLVPFTASLSGLLDRIEQNAHLEGLWRLAPKTQLILGYQFGVINYTADETISEDPTSDFQESSDKDSTSHYLYTGLNHTFTPDFTGSVRIGGRYTDFYNADQDELTPYFRASLRYIYAPESFLEAGASYDLSMSSYADAAAADTANLFATLRHRIMPKLFANVTGQIQNLTYTSGTYEDDNDLIYTAGLNLEYAILPYLSTHIGYNYDAVTSDIPNSDYTRNRVYIGVTATY